MSLRRLVVCVFLFGTPFGTESAQAEPKSGRASTVFDTSSTPADRISVPEGFEVELIYNVPRAEQGSWINLAVDPKGRLITSSEAGSLYRVSVPPKGTSDPPKVERIPVELGDAQGLLCAFGDLYVMVNGRGEPDTNGLYRVRDTDNDDQFDSVEFLRPLQGHKDHGPHAILLAPDGKSLVVVCGNNTPLTKIDRSRVPRIWDEDLLLPRLYGQGFMRGTPPPAGCIYRIDPDGKNWELIACGLRNAFDAAFNSDGELLTYDADMEWDIGMPWYRPTRLCHVVSGVDWGWRNGSAKWPVHYPETLPPAVEIGPGSPTGVTFGYGAKFPAKYQNALFLCDWTFGKMYAAHLRPHGASYTGELEDFLSATPLPLTDVVTNAHDGAMYFTIGGRGVQSGLYRVTYVGRESTEPATGAAQDSAEFALRRELEELHLGEHADAVDKAWAHLAHGDRFVRAAARTAIEHRPRAEWQERALAEQNPRAALAALLALVRQFPRSYQPTPPDLDTPPPTYPVPNGPAEPMQGAMLAALGRIDPAALSMEERLELVRLYALVLYRLGAPNEATRHKLVERLDAMYPGAEREANAMLTELMCFLQAPTAAEKGIELLQRARTQEEQLDLARSLRFLQTGWTPETRRVFLEWLRRAQAYRGGQNFQLVVGEIKADALATMSDDERSALAELIEAPAPEQVSPVASRPRPVVREWTMDEVLPLIETKLKNRDFDRGREMFAAANCFNCHRFDGDGGAVGPDLTVLSGRFSARDILESVMEPDKVINPQYAAMEVVTATGKVHTGRVVNFANNKVVINTNMLDPTAQVDISRTEIEEMMPSSVSMMPKGLLNTLDEEELLDLFAFLLSRGNRDDPMFAQ